MSKNGFQVFVICAIIIIAIGVFIEFKKDKIFFYESAESFSGHYFVKGWEVILLGGIMLAFGLFIKWKVKKHNRITGR